MIDIERPLTALTSVVRKGYLYGFRPLPRHSVRTKSKRTESDLYLARYRSKAGVSLLAIRLC